MQSQNMGSSSKDLNTQLYFTLIISQSYSYLHKNKPNHKVRKFQLILMKFPNLHIVWTEGKNFSLPDLINRSLTAKKQDEHRLRTAQLKYQIL